MKKTMDEINKMIMEDAPMEEVKDAIGYVDITSCFDPVFEPPAELLEEWSKRYEGPEPTLENTSFYVVGPDGTKYFYCGNLCIKISEHFADGGKQMDELVEDAVRHHAGRDSSAPAFLNAV